MAQDTALLVIDMQVALSLGYDLTLVADGHTTWDGALPAAQIIAHHNTAIAGLPLPWRQIDVVPAADVRWERL